MLGMTLSIVIPAVVFGYGIWLAVRLIRNRKKGGYCGGCASCPYAGSCHSTEDCRVNAEKGKNEKAE